MNNDFSSYLKNLREDRGLSIRQLSIFSGVSNSYLSQIETGKRNKPTPDVLAKIAKPLRVSYEELMEKAGYISKDLITEEITNQSDEIIELLEVLHKRPEMKALFSVSKNASRKDIENAIKIIEALKDQ